MTIDERLEALTTRHEALTQTVELLTHDVRELQESTSKLRDAAFALLTIAGQHEKRIQGLEGEPNRAR